MWEIRQNTATTVWVGPFMSTDGISHSTGLTVTYLIAKNNGTFVATTGTNSESTGIVAFYKCPMTATNVNTLGHLKIAAQSSSEYLSVWDDFNVVSQQYYDSKYGTSGFHADIITILTSTSSADDLKSLFAVIGKLPTSGFAGSTEIDDLNNVSTTDILDQSHVGVDASTELDDIATVLSDLNNISTTDILTQSEAALAAHVIDGSLTMDKALTDMDGKLNRDSYKDGNEYKFYSSTGTYLFSLTIATTERTRSS